jgi:hypothetical protein
MTDKRLFLALLPIALLAACTEEPVDEGAATGEVLEGTVSDAMLPLDRVQSEPPLEDPEAFAEVQERAAEAAPGGDEAAGESEGEEAESEAAETLDPAAIPPPEPAD